ncbi:MAG TPA: isoprenylcysteine carboxylmethyltransferase family protein [Casimicrobiaceae bacterium]
MRDVPLLVVALTVSAYWLRVGAMALHVRRRHRHGVGLIPERRSERLLWLVVVPVVAGWCVLPWLAVGRTGGALAVSGFATFGAWGALRWLAALIAVACLATTLHCWHRMGSEWRMDISERKTPLITDGPFRRVRHPIYACSMLMMAATAVVLPTPAMIALAVVHIGWIHYKARAEETQLASVHGDAWRRYVAHTGRFLPRFR